MMRYAARMVLASSLVLMVSLSFGVSRAGAQGPSLGGYGAMAGGSGSSMGGGYNIVDTGMGGNVVVPAAGGSGAAMSPSMSGGGLSFRARPAAGMEASRLSFTLDSMGGMNRTAGGMGARRPFTLQPGNLTGGMGLGGMRRMPAGSGMGVMPPSIGYPFRQPPSLLGSSPSGTGMGM